MSIRPRPETTTRSEHWLRVLINERPDVMQRRLDKASGANHLSPTWLSPLASDGYAEYSDGEFLDLLGIGQLKQNLKDFWPNGGPCWDGLGKTSSDELLLVEATAHTAESNSKLDREKVSEKSLRKIDSALEHTRVLAKATDGEPWGASYYQYANRIAYLYWLNETLNIPTYLVCVYFIDAPDVGENNMTNESQWLSHIDAVEKQLGLYTETPSGPTRHPLAPRVLNLFIPVSELL